MVIEERPASGWVLGRRWAVRFGWVFFGLYFFPFPFDLLPGLGWLTRGWTALGKAAVTWCGTHVLGLPNPILYEPTGSGDTLHDWVFVELILIVSALGGLVWAFLSRAREEDPRLADWLRIYLRYALAAILMGYGFSKVFDLQFSPPGNLLLIQPLGRMTPMMLAWTFMGYSPAYTIFAGVLECLGGLLLLFRRTSSLGALLAAVVLANVVMMNLSYDIPVKLHASLYLVTAIWILAPAVKPLAELLVFHRMAQPELSPSIQWQGWRNRLRWGAKAMLAGWIVCSNAWENASDWRQWRASEHHQSGPVEGFFEIKAMTRDGKEVPRLYTDAQGWRWVSIGGSSFRLATVDGTRLPSSRMIVDDAKRAMVLTEWTTSQPGSAAGPKGELTYAWTDARHLVLKGRLGDAPVELWLEKRETESFPLMNRGFHWISEHPYTHAN